MVSNGWNRTSRFSEYFQILENLPPPADMPKAEKPKAYGLKPSLQLFENMVGNIKIAEAATESQVGR